MLRTITAVLLMGLATLAACQSNQGVVEVTRLVETEQRVEVTRIVSETIVQEATRLVIEEVEVELLVEVTKQPLGSDARPVQLLFPPRFETDLVARRGVPLVEALYEATGYQFRSAFWIVSKL